MCGSHPTRGRQLLITRSQALWDDFTHDKSILWSPFIFGSLYWRLEVFFKRVGSLGVAVEKAAIVAYCVPSKGHTEDSAPHMAGLVAILMLLIAGLWLQPPHLR